VLYGKAAYWVAYGGVQSDKTKESVIEFQKELHFIAGQKPVSPAELDGAKGTRIRGFAQEFESLGRVSEQAVQLWSLGVPFSELEREPAQLRSATSESVNAAAEKYANPSHATLLLVGDRAKIEPELRELNVGEIVTLDVEGRTTAGGAQSGLSVK
jgi:zinc protease